MERDRITVRHKRHKNTSIRSIGLFRILLCEKSITKGSNRLTGHRLVRVFLGFLRDGGQIYNQPSTKYPEDVLRSSLILSNRETVSSQESDVLT